MKIAFISVSDKSGIVELAEAFLQQDIQVIASKGTADYLIANQIHAQSIEAYLQLSPLLDGRVKTLHPHLFGGILADRNNETHLQQLQALDAGLIDFVIVDLYPFAKAQSIETIDIGGVALIRAAAKNHQFCTVIYDKQDYPELIARLANDIPLSYKKELAGKTFRYCSQYDALIASWLQNDVKNLNLEKSISLAYGENPHQQAAFYNRIHEQPNIQLLQGKPLTYNNLLDIHAGVALISEFKKSACCVIKHTNPCGVAQKNNLLEAVTQAWQADAKSAFGGIVVMNELVDEAIVDFLMPHFIEIIAAPKFTAAALAKLTNKKCRVITWQRIAAKTELRSTLNGYLQQTVDNKSLEITPEMMVTLMRPSLDSYFDMIFAHQVIRHMKSNAIVIVKKGVTLAMGLGQTNRVDAVEQALKRAENFDLTDAVLASDGFFPFADSIELISQTNIKTIIQPGGSRQDDNVIASCNLFGIAMILHGLRGFKH